MLYRVVLYFLEFFTFLNSVVFLKVINTDYYFKDIYRFVDQAKAVSSLNHTNFEQSTLKYHSTDKFENETFDPYTYFGLGDNMYDGEWESSATNQDADKFYPSSFTQRKGRVSAKFIGNYNSKFESGLKVTIDMYNGEFRNEALNFQIDFEGDFKNASHSYLEVETTNKFKEVTFYRLYRSYYSKNYDIKSMIRKHASKGIFLIEVTNHSNTSNTTINISLNPFYSGSKERHQIIETVIIIVILVIFSGLLIKIETLCGKSGILSLYVSPVSVSIAAFWFVLLGFEHLYLSFSFEDYRWLGISSLAYFGLAAQLVISIKHAITLKLKNLSINGGILLGILLFVAISILVLNEMIFNPHLMALGCGFVWMPQIFNDIINGFCADHDYFEYSLTLSMLFIPISLNLFKSNIFEVQPNVSLILTVIFILAAQLLLLKLMNTYGCRFLMPRFICLHLFKPKSIKFTNPEDFEGSICLENRKEFRRFKLQNIETVTLRCNHSFHFKCIRRSLQIKNSCPLCRSRVFDDRDELRKFRNLV